MAYIGITRPVVAPYSEENGKAKYSGGIRFGKAVKITIDPQYEGLGDYRDINDTETDDEFSYADITLDTDEVPEEAEPMMFGRETDGISRESDHAGYVGVGIRTRKIKNGRVRYTAIWIHKVKFREGSCSHETKGDSINYQTPSTPGTAEPDVEGKWRTKKTFETAEEADSWIDEIAGIERED